MTDKPVTGRCLCGGIRYEYIGVPARVLHCHCESCRRHTSCPVSTFVCVPAENFRFTKGEPVGYASSPGVTRTHCGRCGSPLTYTSTRTTLVDIYAGTLDEPAAIVPTYHAYAEEQLPWFEIADALPRFAKGSIGQQPVRHGPRSLD